MKIASNKDFLVIDTENNDTPNKRIYAFITSTKKVKTYGINELQDNLYSPFEYDFDKQIAELCEKNNFFKE